jgi:hypothetical protein
MAHLTGKHFAPLIVVSVAALAAGAASGFEITQPIPGGAETACLDVSDSKTASGTPIIAYPCDAGFNEQWNFDDKGHLEGIGTANGETKCLERNGSNLAILSSCNQTWGLQIVIGSINWIFLEPGGSSCLDSRGKYGSTAQVVVDDCNPNAFPIPSQGWVARDIVITQPIPDTDETACVDVSGNSIVSGTPVTAYPCKLGGNERWENVNGELQGVSSKGATTCLGWVQATNKVELETCGGANNTAWLIGGGTIINYYAEASQAGVACLDSRSKYGEVQLVLSACSNPSPSSQLWRLQ